MTKSKVVIIDRHPGRSAQTIGVARELGTDPDLIHEPSVGVVGTKGDSQCYNRLRRRTDPPRHFDESWKLPHSFLGDVSVVTAIAEPATPPMDPNAALEKLRLMAQAVLSEYNDLLVKYPHPTQMP